MDEKDLDGFGRGALATLSMKSVENRAGVFSIVGASVLRSFASDAHQRAASPEPSSKMESSVDQHDEGVLEEMTSAPPKRPRSTGDRSTRRAIIQKV